MSGLGRLRSGWGRGSGTGAGPGSGTGAATGPGAPDPELVAQRDRVAERFALLQSELGGLFYEMAIRDHVRMDVLIDRAAALQRVDAELGNLEHLIAQGGEAPAGNCPTCGTSFARGAAFCSQCATPLAG